MWTHLKKFDFLIAHTVTNFPKRGHWKPLFMSTKFNHVQYMILT